MTPDQAAELAARTLAAVPDSSVWLTEDEDARFAADRERVASDLAGLRMTWEYRPNEQAVITMRGWFADGLRRTGRLYGVTE